MAGGLGAPTSGGGDFEANITTVVIISCILVASGGLMFGYDVGISGTCVSRDALSLVQIWPKAMDYL